MAINLQKGGRINLKKVEQDLPVSPSASAGMSSSKRG
jgi:hypothetical protein